MRIKILAIGILCCFFDICSQLELAWLQINARQAPKGFNGFDELRKYIKHGADFCKEMSSVLQERSELEATYAKGLFKLANKIGKITRDGTSTICKTWQEVAIEMEKEADLHRNVASGLAEDVVKPLKNVIESQHKTRKLVETTVDKSVRNLSDRRSDEQKARQKSYMCTRENERMQEQALDAKATRGKVLTEKDITKLETKRRKAEEAQFKADQDYYIYCVRTERSRQEWETSVYRAINMLQQLEEERLAQMHDFTQKYANHLSVIGPKKVQFCERLNSTISHIDITSDLQIAINITNSGSNVPEQLLPDFYAEDSNNNMKKERRKESLEKFLQMLKHDLELERKGKQGVENLAKVFQETPNFGDAEAQQDVNEKLQHLRATLTYLEACRYKLQCGLADLNNQARKSHPLSSHMEQFKDKQGMPYTILKIPRWVRMERRNSDSSTSLDSDVPDNNYYNSVSNDIQDGPNQIYANLPCRQHSVESPRNPSQCKALYEYQARLSDELSFHPGDVINVLKTMDDGWWQGELHGIIGLFPSTYVTEIK